MTSLRTLLGLGLLASATGAGAVPPLVIGDVPTADPGTVEVHAGVERVKDGGVEWAAPTTELVLGISSWQEITLELPYLVVDGAQGVGDVVLGTKLLLLPAAPGRPGLAGSVEWKLASGDQAAGLGSGAMELGLLLRAQQTWSWFTLIGNSGYTLVGEPRVAGVSQPRRNTGFLGLGGEGEATGRITLLGDLYWRSSDVSGGPARVAGDLGLKLRVKDHLAVNGAVGASLRRDQLGGPQLRAYLGLKGDFVVF